MPHQCTTYIVIGDDGFPTNVLVSEARTITATWHSTPLRKYKSHVVYVGVFLEALLNFAGKDPIPDSGRITGERYTAGVIYTAYRDRKVFEVAEAWFGGMVQPVKTAGFANNKTIAVHCILQKLTKIVFHFSFLDPIDEIPLCLQVGHIVPVSLKDFAMDSGGKLHSSALTWAMIRNWMSVSIQSLKGVGMNNSSNGILFCPNGHGLFGSFKFWFEPTVMWVSGAAEYLKSIFRDQEDIILASNGSTDISSLLLNKFAAIAISTKFNKEKKNKWAKGWDL
ncbi:hypothetical protein BU17DRAFT_61756 [Hysterangium stoloniferum]|nr:hypothetical protein BU17DRAFT_61756 [Hysterangium stoloniferum]